MGVKPERERSGRDQERAAGGLERQRWHYPTGRRSIGDQGNEHRPGAGWREE